MGLQRRAVALLPLLWIGCLARLAIPSGAAAAPSQWDPSAIGAQAPLRAEPETDTLEDVLRRVERADRDTKIDPIEAPHQVLAALLSALGVMQDHYFEIWMGTWPDAIDWTAAVMGTHVSGALNAITRSPLYAPQDSAFGSVSENTISGYFSQVSSFYFGENAVDLRLQAHDDMLWVVLGWLEAIQLIRTHSDLHYAATKNSSDSTWYARHFIPGFAHRARIFWDLADKGWDTTLCGGGMIWSPYLSPYKNAITNQLYIAASINMYLYFPGDNNDFPFSQADTLNKGPLPEIEPHEDKYRTAAVTAYDWLMDSGMTNGLGLFVDGFHIRGYEPGRGGSNGTGQCDVRNNMVYTYNQGVILTGQRGLWRATGNTTYLHAGHELIRAVVGATGYRSDGTHFPFWTGLGRRGIMEERCDTRGDCSQNGQTFKGIFFHHFAAFCAPLETDGDGEVFHGASPEEAADHARSCSRYAPWLARNARAAAGTRDGEGEFGEWWTPGLEDWEMAAEAEAQSALKEAEPAVQMPEEDETGEDYRNAGVPESWQLPNIARGWMRGSRGVSEAHERVYHDPNQRGRGRTVETQSGGVAVLKALYALVERRQGDDEIGTDVSLGTHLQL